MAPPRRRDGFEYRRSERLQRQREMRIFRETFDQQPQVDDAITIDEDVHEASDTSPVPPAEVEVDFQETPQQMGRGVDRPTGWWKMRNGKFIRMSEMEDGHLRNTISMIQRASHSRGRLPSSDSYRELLTELRMREGRQQREEADRVRSYDEAIRRSEQRVNEIRQQEERRVLDARVREQYRDSFLAQQSPTGRRLFNQMMGNPTPQRQETRLRRLIQDGDILIRTPRTILWRIDQRLEDGFYLNEETSEVSFSYEGTVRTGVIHLPHPEARIDIPLDVRTTVEEIRTRVSRVGTVRAVGTRRLERLTRQQSVLIRTRTFIPWPAESLMDGFYLDENSRSIFLACRGEVTTLLRGISDAAIASDDMGIAIPVSVVEVIDRILDNPSIFDGLGGADSPAVPRTAAGADVNPHIFAGYPGLMPVETASGMMESRRAWLSNAVEREPAAPEPVLPTKGRRIKTK